MVAEAGADAPRTSRRATSCRAWAHAYFIDGVYRFPVAHCAGSKPQPAAIAAVPQAPKTRPASSAAHKRPDYEAIALRLSTPAQITKRMHHESQPTRRPRRDEPMTEIESRLAAIWCDLLKRPSVPLSGNFFDLGGHSLLAVVLIMRVKEAFDVELPIDDVYSAGLTLGDLARKVEAHPARHARGVRRHPARVGIALRRRGGAPAGRGRSRSRPNPARYEDAADVQRVLCARRAADRRAAT